MSDQTQPRVWREGDPEPGLDVQAVQHTNSQVFLRLPWPVRYGPRNATTVWQAGKLGRPLSWEQLTEQLHGHTLTEFDPSALTEVQMSSPVPSPTEDGNASERTNQPGEITSARAALDATIGGMAAGLAEAGKNLRRNLETVGLVPASERPNAGQDDAHEIERLKYILAASDGAGEEWHKLATAGVTAAAKWKARADAAEAKLAGIRTALVNHAAHAQPYSLLHSIHEIVTPEATPVLGDVIKCQRCGRQTRSISRGCSVCKLGREHAEGTAR